MNSLYEILIAEFGNYLTPQTHRKATLTVLSHALENEVIQNKLSPVIFAAFQDTRYFEIEKQRYDLLKQTAQAVVVYGKGLEMSANDLEQDWFVVINEPRFKALLVAQQLPGDQNSHIPAIYKQYKLVWTYEAAVIDRACILLVEQTLPSKHTAATALSKILAQPHFLSEQAQSVQHVEENILAKLELTNLNVLQQIVRSQQLIGNLEQQKVALGQLSIEHEALMQQKNKIHHELKQLYVEFNRTQNLMTRTFIERNRLLQHRAQSLAILAQLQQVIATWQQHTLPPSDLAMLANLLDELANLNQSN